MPPWDEARARLKAGAGVESLARGSAERCLRDGVWRSYDSARPSRPAVVLDVRRESAFAAEHLPGSVNLPIFTEDVAGVVQESTLSPTDMMLNNNYLFRYLSLGTVINETFVDKALEVVEGDLDTPLFVMCARGGNLDATNDAFGRGVPSHSLVAIDALRSAGFSNVMHVEKGYYGTPDDALCETRTVPANAPHKVLSGGLVALTLGILFAPTISGVLTHFVPGDIDLAVLSASQLLSSPWE